MIISTRLLPAALLLSVVASGCTYTVEAARPTEAHVLRPPPLSRLPPPPPRPPPPPIAASWEKVAELTVDGRADRDRLRLGRSEGGFRALQFKVTRSSIRMYDIRINFIDGSSYSPSTKLVFGPGDTRTVDLPGDVRTIRDIEFRYGDLPGGGQAHVQVWGR